MSGSVAYAKEIRQTTFNEAKTMANRHVHWAGGGMWGGVVENMTRHGAHVKEPIGAV